MEVKYLIIGAGPTGLGAGWRMRELGMEDFLILERNPHVGGLSASFTDSAGFIWDIGGHVLFSHYEYYDKLLDTALQGQYLEHQRIARVRMARRWIPYPFQNNIRHLPGEIQWECVQGLLPGHRSEHYPENFAQWFDYVFGPGITKYFMRPYNFKVWATPAEDMGFSWIGERVSVVDLEMVLKNLLLELDDVGWGPNRVFRFPLHGGTGAIYQGIAKGIRDRIILDRPVTWIDAERRVVRTPAGDIRYEHLLNTAPLDILVRDILDQAPDVLRGATRDLAHNGVFVAGVGVPGTREDDTCWMYFPESNCPFYRLTNFHNYSPNNVSPAGGARGYMAETSFSGHKPENLTTLMDATVQGLVNTEMMTPEEVERTATRWEMAVDYGYPVPTLGRDKALEKLIPWLEERGIHSRGRFGGWKYEVSNMDHSVMQGVEWCERMLLDKPETTYKVEK